MSQAVTAQNPVAQMLASIKANISAGFQAPTDESLSDGIGSSYGIIHYRGKVWSLSYRGQNYIFTRQDDGSPSSYIDVIILRQARTKSKSLYEGFDQDAANKRPICSSLAGDVPDMDAQSPQSTNCATCPRNIWKTDPQGRRSKDCSDYKRTAVLLMPNVTGRMMGGQALMEPVFLRVPAASLADLSSYGDQLQGAGLPFYGIVTRVSFDPTKAHPQMQFRPIQGLTSAEEPVVLPLREDNLAKRIVGEDQPARQLLAAPVVTQPVLQQPQNVPLTNGFVQPIQPAQVLHVTPPAQPIIVQAPAAAPEPTTIETGFAPVNAAPTFVPPPAQVIEGEVVNAGAPEEADAAIDSRLANIFPGA